MYFQPGEERGAIHLNPVVWSGTSIHYYYIIRSVPLSPCHVHCGANILVGVGKVGKGAQKMVHRLSSWIGAAPVTGTILTTGGPVPADSWC